MDRKSIGSFIAALRRANGLTQKELAQRLNVSDKTVSRWETDESAPELGLVPVISEIFGVTSDELLRGEKTPAGGCEERDLKPRAEKQRRRLFAAELAKFKNKSYVAWGLAGCGLIAALICNLAFLRAYLGFFIGAVFLLAAAVTEAVCLSSAFLAVSDDELDGAEVGAFKRSVIVTAERIFGLCFVLLAATLPLVTLVDDALFGLSGGSMLLYGVIFAACAFIIWAVAVHFINILLLNRRVYVLSEKKEAAYRRNIKLKRVCVLTLLAALLVTFAGNSLATGFQDIQSVAKGTEFNDLDSFKEFMEKGASSEAQSSDDRQTVLPPEATVGPQAEYAAKTHEIKDKNGVVICEFVNRNDSIASWRVSYSGDDFQSVTAFTDDQISEGAHRIERINIIFAFVYILEAAAALLIYLRKRAR